MARRPGAIAALLGFGIGLLVVGVSLPAGAAEDAVGRTYGQARTLFYALQGDADRKQLRHNWERVINAFVGVTQRFPGTPEAAKALFTTAELWKDLYAISRRPSDLEHALSTYDRLVELFPKHHLADDALWHRAEIALAQGAQSSALQDWQAIVVQHTTGDMAGRARSMLAKYGGQRVAASVAAKPRPDAAKGVHGTTPTVTGLRHFANPVYTRVVIYLSGPVKAKVGELPARPGANLPHRIFVDIEGARVGPEVEPVTEVKDEVLARIRAGQHDDSSVRVVLDLKQHSRHRLMILEEPHRVIMDAYGPEAGDGVTNENATAKKKVVIDPGHGGDDIGAPGPNGVHEKHVVLAIAKEAAKALRKAGMEVLLTRKGDTFLSLEDRTAAANRFGADAFVSIHANSHKDAGVGGIETYFLDVTHDRYALRLAARENKTGEQQVSDLQLILADLTMKVNTRDSSGLARRVQKRLVRAARPFNAKARDLGVKASLFYVLLGARMPCVLVETSFISNKQEGKLLTSRRYQAALAKAIADAIVEHLGQPVVLARP